MLQYVIGDVLNDSPDLKRKLIVQVVNDIGVMGAGFAKAVMDKYPKVHEEYVKWHKYEYCMIGKQQIPFKLGQIQLIQVENGVYVINMIAQHQTIRENPKPIRYAALARCMEKVALICDKLDGEIHGPLFGGGLAKGNFSFIEELIDEIWTTQKVLIYKLPDQK